MHGNLETVGVGEINYCAIIVLLRYPFSKWRNSDSIPSIGN